MDEMREVFFPYCLLRQPDGRYAVLNRRYKPVGYFTGGWVEYGSHPVLVRLKITSQMAASVSWINSDNTDEIFLYNDSCVPTRSPAAMAAYLERISRMMAWKIQDALPRENIDSAGSGNKL